MSTTYKKPVVLLNEDLAEGVYAASGGNGADCYTVTTNIHQKPETGRGDYRIQVNGVHAAIDHHSEAQTLVLYFNMPVEYVGSNGTLADGDGTATLSINYSYHNNASDNIGLGDVIVKANVGLSITDAKIVCNRDCAQHNTLPNYP